MSSELGLVSVDYEIFGDVQDYDSLEIQQQYNDINNRWDLAAENDWDNENSSARLFERSRIKALAEHSREIPPGPDDVNSGSDLFDINSGFEPVDEDPSNSGPFKVTSCTGL
ncbi:SPTB2 protein, partial [Polypterus senegalus]